MLQRNVQSDRDVTRSTGVALLRPLRGQRRRTHSHTYTRSATPVTGSLGVLTGHFAVFGRWTEINSAYEGRFLERIAPGAFTTTFAEDRQRMRCLFQHGRDPHIGLKPLGSIRELDQDQTGARYDVDLLDVDYVRSLVPGLRSGVFGASFRFVVEFEDVDDRPLRSTHNPDAIPERTLRQVRVREFGPVTFGAYEDATAGIRSALGGSRLRPLSVAQRERRPWHLPSRRAA